MDNQDEPPAGRTRTTEKTKPRGSIALEETLWRFVLDHGRKAGLSKNAVYRQALSAFKAAIESGTADASLDGPLYSPEDDASSETGFSSEFFAITEGVQITEKLFETLERMRLLKFASKGGDWDAGSKHRRLIRETTPLFEPLMRLLVEADMIALSVELIKRRPENIDSLWALTGEADHIETDLNNKMQFTGAFTHGLVDENGVFKQT